MAEGGGVMPVSSPRWVRLRSSIGCEKITVTVTESGSFTQPTYEKLPPVPSLPAKNLFSLSSLRREHLSQVPESRTAKQKPCIPSYSG